MLQIEPGEQSFVGICRGLDLAKPLEASPLDALKSALTRYSVMVFPGPPLSLEAQLRFSSHFGDLEPTVQPLAGAGPQRLGDAPVSDQSNLDAHDQIVPADDRKRLFNIANQFWHSDSSFKDPPASYSLLDAHVVPPEGGDTEFVDTRDAWDRLPAGYQQRIADLEVEHSLMYSRAQLGFVDLSDDERRRLAPVLQPLVRRDPTSGRMAVFLSSHIGRVIGWFVPEGLALIRDLTERATLPQYVYRHRWAVGDLVMYDNRRTMHRARPYFESTTVYKRDLRRVTLAGEPARDRPQGV